MTTELRLAETLKQLMGRETLDKITVKMLTEQSGITRPTFYYHFSDIYDLLTWIFINETIEGFDKAKSWTDAILKLGKYCLANRTLVRQTYASAGRDLVSEFLYNHLYAFHMNRLEDIDRRNTIETESRKRLAAFYSAALNSILGTWIEGAMKDDLSAIVNDLSIHLGDYIAAFNNGEPHANI